MPEHGIFCFEFAVRPNAQAGDGSRSVKLATGGDARPKPYAIVSATAFTVMPCCPSSRAKRRVSITTSAFVAA